MTEERERPPVHELAIDAAITRREVAADVRALKSQLTVEALKDRAVDAAERSVESVALRALRRLAVVPRAAADYARQHPEPALAFAGGLGLIGWAAVRRARR